MVTARSPRPPGVQPAVVPPEVLLDNLERAVSELGRIDAARTAALARRDHLLLAARNAGVTWRTLQTIAGLSPRGLQKALDRAADASLTPQDDSEPAAMWSSPPVVELCVRQPPGRSAPP